MADDTALSHLRAIRDDIVRRRRSSAATAAGYIERGGSSPMAVGELISAQQSLEVIDRAIADEDGATEKERRRAYTYGMLHNID